jgi:subtilisin family serine protease
MPQLQVIVPQLNKRSFPVEDTADKSNITGVVFNGFRFQSIAQQSNNSGTWFQDVNGSFYWGGGVTMLPEIARPVPENAQQHIDNLFNGQKLTGKIDYNFLLNTNSEIKQTNGKGITVAIVDHPISKDKDLKFKNAIVRPIDVDHPASDHATFIAGLIAGVSDISGIATDVTIVELPIRDENGFPQTDLIKKSIDFINSFNGPMIVNISQQLPNQFKDDITSIKNKIIVASAGKDNELQNQELIFPALLPNVIAVGCISNDFLNLNSTAPFNNRLDFVLPDLNYASYSMNDNKVSSDSGDSFASAVVTGTIALLFSAGKINDTLSNAREELVKISRQYKDKTNFNFLNPIIPVI